MRGFACHGGTYREGLHRWSCDARGYALGSGLGWRDGKGGSCGTLVFVEDGMVGGWVGGLCV